MEGCLKKKFAPDLQCWVLKVEGKKQKNYFQHFFKLQTLGLKFDKGHEEIFFHNFYFLKTFHFQFFGFPNIYIFNDEQLEHV
jgi:hypothetical protein